MEDTLTAENNEAMVAEMLRSAKGIELPSDLKQNPVIHKENEELPARMVVSELQSGKYFWIWETDSHEKVPCLGYMLQQKLRQHLPSGKPRFTLTNPGILPKRGSLKCLLHQDSPDRDTHDEMGFATCPKSNITNRHQLEMHMRKRHKQEWEAIENDRLSKEREEDRTLQRLLLANAASNAQETKETIEKESFTCEKCNKEFRYRKTYRNHIKTCK